MTGRAVNTDTTTSRPKSAQTETLSIAPRRSRRSRVFRFARRDPIIVSCFLVLFVLMLFAIAPSVFARFDPVEINAMDRLQGPSLKHYFGTDNLGRDLFARVVHAARTTLGSAFIVVAVASFIGINIGSLAGYSGKIADEILMRFTDLFMAFPLLVLAMAIVAALGPSLLNAMTALIVIWWTQYARLTRGLVLQMKNREFVTAAHAIGASRSKILYRHILPNCFSPLLVKGTLDIAVAVLVTASLSFLGLGVQPPDPDWGNMISDGRQFVQDAWWYPTFPGLAIFITVMSLNLIGDAVRDLLDPRLRK